MVAEPNALPGSDAIDEMDAEIARAEILRQQSKHQKKIKGREQRQRTSQANYIERNREYLREPHSLTEFRWRAERFASDFRCYQAKLAGLDLLCVSTYIWWMALTDKGRDAFLRDALDALRDEHIQKKRRQRAAKKERESFKS